MTASLYQRGSRGWTEMDAFTLGEIVEVALAAHMAPNAEDVGGRVTRVEEDVVARSFPQVARAGEQIVSLEGLLCRESHRGQVDIDKSRLRVMRVDDDEHGLIAVRMRLAVGEQRIVIDGMEFQAAVALQRRVVAADAVHARDEVAQAVRTLQVPVTQLVLLRIKIIFAAGVARRMLHELKCRAVYPV